MLSLVASAAVDNSIAAEETGEIRERWERVKSATEDFVNCCEQGNFEDIHPHAMEKERGSKLQDKRQQAMEL